MFARENSNAVYPATGVREGFHNASHHSNERKNMDQFAVINRYHVKMLAYFLEKLQATPDGDGTLLDHSMILYGSSLSDGNEHNFDPLPVVLAGGASGQLQGGRHLRHAPHTPMSNLLLACSTSSARRSTRSATAPGGWRSERWRRKGVGTPFVQVTGKRGTTPFAYITFAGPARLRPCGPPSDLQRRRAPSDA